MPRWAACTRIWWVRPVRGCATIRLATLPTSTGTKFVVEALPFRVHPHDALSRTALFAQQSRVATTTPWTEHCRGQVRDSAFAPAPFAAPRAAKRACCALFATRRHPEVSRSIRWTSSIRRAAGRAARKHSMTPKSTPAAAVHRPSLPACSTRSTRRLHTRIARSTGLSPSLCRRLSRLGLHRPHRGNPHDVADCETVVRSHAAAVDPNLATTQQPVDSRTWNTLEVEGEEVVDALPGGRLVHGDLMGRFPARSACLDHRKMVPVWCSRQDMI